MDPIKKIKVIKIASLENRYIDDFVSVEEPLEIRLVYGPPEDRQKKSVSITMRTPGDDENLAMGFLKNEGIIRDVKDVLKCAFQTFHKGELNPNIITVHLHPEVNLHTFSLERNFYTTSSCGLCGKASIEAVQNIGIPHLQVIPAVIDISMLLSLPDKIKEYQLNFAATGGLHAAALFDAKGKMLHVAEDVGRHNAMDKLSGWIIKHNSHLDLSHNILVLSGRTSFELIQKAAFTGIPIVCAVGAPSSLAIETAEAANITLTGFTKTSGANIYSHAERISGL
jgi:FdhD protein